MQDRYVSFSQLPKNSQEHLLAVMGLANDERQIIWLRYTREYSHAEIAAEMGVSERSVSRKLAQAKKHAWQIAGRFYPLADEKSKMLIDALGWRELDWPVEANRRRANERERERERFGSKLLAA